MRIPPVEFAGTVLMCVALVQFSAGAAVRAPAETPDAPRPALTPLATSTLGSHVLLSWNDLGMHCMNLSHRYLSVLPPFNNLYGQVIQRGDATHPPQLVTTGVTVEYSFPGNTYSVGKTDFWTYAPALFGVSLPPNIGLTGKGLTGTLDTAATHFVAPGVPLTPFPDASPTVENPYQQALVLARGAGGLELARSTPVVPVSVEMHCVSSGCHSSEPAILQAHESVAGFNASSTPILCGGCHADPALGTVGRPDASYFSFRMHDAHKFIDEQYTGTAACYKCHPGGQAQCLRGNMAVTWGLVCQDCHGNMSQVSSSIETGRVPWVNEPSCATCHQPRFAENPGKLFKVSVGHGGVMCEGCHNSTHADVPTRIPADNANMLALQGKAASLGNCFVCHGSMPAGAGPHGEQITGVPEREVPGALRPIAIRPNPARGTCTLQFVAAGKGEGTLMVYDVNGRAVRLLRPTASGGGNMTAAWDGRNGHGQQVQAGTYFVRWLQEGAQAAGRVVRVR